MSFWRIVVILWRSSYGQVTWHYKTFWYSCLLKCWKKFENQFVFGKTCCNTMLLYLYSPCILRRIYVWGFFVCVRWISEWGYHFLSEGFNAKVAEVSPLSMVMCVTTKPRNRSSVLSYCSLMIRRLLDYSHWATKGQSQYWWSISRGFLQFHVLFSSLAKLLSQLQRAALAVKFRSFPSRYSFRTVQNTYELS